MTPVFWNHLKSYRFTMYDSRSLFQAHFPTSPETYRRHPGIGRHLSPFRLSALIPMNSNVNEIYGDHERLFKCPSCGLKDYNRDLNAARNIASR